MIWLKLSIQYVTALQITITAVNFHKSLAHPAEIISISVDVCLKACIATFPGDIQNIGKGTPSSGQSLIVKYNEQ